MRHMGAGLIIHIPHASTAIPDEVRRSILISDAELDKELLLMTDRYTDDLPLKPGPARVVRAPVSRLVVDVERFRSNGEEEMARKGMGAVYTRTHDGKELRRLTKQARESLLRRYYDPHHHALAEAVRAGLWGRGRCLIVDVHSFSDTPLPHEKDKSTPRPDICLGTCGAHTPESLYLSAREFFEERGFRVKRDSPFSGSMVPLEFLGKDPNVQSIMIEMNRKWIADPETGAKSSNAERMLGAVAEWIDQIGARAGPAIAA